MKAEVISLVHICETFPDTAKDEIDRDIYIETAKRMLESLDLIFIEGGSGSGKSTFLSQFARKNSFTTITHFITSSFKYSYNPISFKNSLFRQLYFFTFDQIFDKELNVDDNYFNSIYGPLLKKLKKSTEPLYFAIDGLDEIPSDDLNVLKSTLSLLPWTKAKFILSGQSEKLVDLIPSRIRHKPFSPSYFSLGEAKEFFKDFSPSDEQIVEIYSICRKGMPERLVQVKRLCRDAGSIEKFISKDFSPKTDLFEIEWKANDLDDLQRRALGVLAFDESKISVNKFAQILKVEANTILRKLSPIQFLECNDDFVEIHSESLKKYMQTQLLEYRDETNEILIDYYTRIPSSDESLFNLPGILTRAKKWQELIKFLSIKGFVQFLERTQSLSSIKRQFEYGLDASKQINQFTGEYLRFSLHKSSVKELEKTPTSQSEIEARIAVGDFDTANSLANSSLLKEDRIKLLAIIAKCRKEQKLPEDKILNDQIRDLYDQIDWKLMKGDINEISGLLLYSFPDLAIELIEKGSETEKSMDIKFAILSLSAIQANLRARSKIANIDLISSKIKDSKTKLIAEGLRFISEEYGSEQIIYQAENLSDLSRKLYMLKSWISNNLKTPGIEKVITYSLNLIFSSADIEAPNATSLSELSTPLPYIEDQDSALEIVRILDSQKNTITYPTTSFIALQLTIAECLYNFDEDRGKDRIFEIYLLIDDIDDLSVKEDCLALLWAQLEKLGRTEEIQSSLSTKSTLESQVRSQLQQLLSETAYHYEMIDKVVIALCPVKPDFVFEAIQLLNTEDRRNYGFYLAIRVYLMKEYNTIDFSTLIRFYNGITSRYLREKVFLSIIEKIYENKEEAKSIVPKVERYIPLVWEFVYVEFKCQSLIKIISILNQVSANYDGMLKRSYGELNKTWSSIDSLWERIDTGFQIVKELSEFDLEESKRYLNESAILKREIGLTSTSLANTYILTIRLCIAAFEGLSLISNDFSGDLASLSSLISSVGSSSEKLKLWNLVALNLHANNKFDAFRSIVKEKISPILSTYTAAKHNEYQDTICDISPTLFHFHSDSFFDRVEPLDREVRDQAYSNVSDYILTKIPELDSETEYDKAFPLTYEEHKDLCTLSEEMEDDSLIYANIEEQVKALKMYKLPGEQRNDIVGRIEKIIQKKFPSKTSGIKHEGYVIISEVQLQSLQIYNKAEWEKLLDRARAIPNLSDKAFVISIIADGAPVNKNKKTEIIQEAVNEASKISSAYDRSRRFDYAWKIAYDIGGRTLFDKIGRESIKTIIKDDDVESNIKTLVDTAQKYDPSLAEHIATIVDQDPVRAKLQMSVKQRIKSNQAMKDAKGDFSLLKKLDEKKILKIFNENLSELNIGKINPSDIDENMMKILDAISRIPLTSGASAALFFIKNAILRYKNSQKNHGILVEIFKATLENARLVDILSMDSIPKMENRIRFESSQSTENAIIRIGERAKAFSYISNWLEDNLKEKVTIIDPYFSESDLEIVQMIQKVKPKCQISVLTSKENGINNTENNENYYNLAWSKISEQFPPDALIQIVWISPTMKSPFHDRWIICEDVDAGLKIGTSLNSIGIKKDSTIDVMPAEDVLALQRTIVSDYLVNRIRTFGENRLYYTSFQLSR